MPRYDYRCPANNRVIEVRHGSEERVESWGELCARAGLDPGETPPEARVERLIYAPALAFPKGDAQLRSMGFTKLVRRDSGVYENVTAGDGDARVVSADDPSSLGRLKTTISTKIGD